MNSRSRLAAFRNFGLGIHPGYPRFQPGVGFLPPIGPQFNIARPGPGQPFSLPPMGPSNPFLNSSLPMLSKPEPSPGPGPLSIPKYPFSLVRQMNPQTSQTMASSLLLPSLTNSLAIYSNLRLLSGPNQVPMPSPPDAGGVSPPPISIKQEQEFPVN